ncbi:IS701 family transposase [Streptomyces sp. NBC_01497]|uniref:IS701 family transposase n=1 Tax=Streptomyces sp. NBC_01497 TaxID=2903885 RepID=UPI003FCE25EB
MVEELADVWSGMFDDFVARFAGRFGRVESRRRMVSCLRGLLSEVERENGWMLAEAAGDTGHQGDAAAAVEPLPVGRGCSACDVRDAVVEHIGDPVRGVLIFDETGFLKKGVRSAGVGRQYSGSAGRIGNAQIGVFLAYGSSRGRELVDRELYLPKDWTSDRERCRAAGIGDDVEFVTKPDMGLRMLQRAVGTAQPHRSHGHRLLHLLLPSRDFARRARPSRGIEVDGRGVLPEREERNGTRSLPSPRLRGVVLAHNPLHGRSCLSRYRAGRGKKGDPHTRSNQPLIPVTVNEARRIFNRISSPVRHSIQHLLAWSLWRRKSQARARIRHYKRRGHHGVSLQY